MRGEDHEDPYLARKPEGFRDFLFLKGVFEIAARKVLYYDCFSGISGDMNLGAMLDLGVDSDYLREELKKLNLSGYQLKVYQDQRKGITGTRVEVVVALDHHVSHSHRNLRDIRQIVEESALSEQVKEWSLEIFARLAEAEARVHGQSIDEMHFHEVGAVDSIVDVVGAAICREKLGIDKIVFSPIEVGGGFVECAHGRLPVPAPATAELLQGVPITSQSCSGELTTPTGAAIAVTFAEEFTTKKNFRVLKVGYGVGERDNEDIPNILRVFLGEIEENASLQEEGKKVVVVETNIDDMSPEAYEYVMEKLFEGGALDVYFTPVIMKKGRPATKISVLCWDEDTEKISEILFQETTTLGVRKYQVERRVMNRKKITVQTPYGNVEVKLGLLGDKLVKFKPEYEQCRRIARERKLSLSEVYEMVKEACKCTYRMGF